MHDYQIAVITFFVCMLASIIIFGLIDKAVKRHRAKKEAYAELERKNKQLEDKIYRLKFQAELRGVNLDV